MKIPNPKSQIPNKLQVLNSKPGLALPHTREARPGLEFEVWNLFGIWILDFGISHATH